MYFGAGNEMNGGGVPKENGHTLPAELFVVKNSSVVTGIPVVRTKQKKDGGGLMQKCVKCVLDNFELSYGPLTEECKNEILKKSGSFMVKHCLDFLACFFIITPCIIAFWRGTWDYATIYLEKKAFQGDCVTANTLCLVFGIVGTQLVQWSQYWVKKNIAKAYNPRSSPARFYLVSRLFSLIWGFCDIYMWKGVWDGIDCIFGMNVLSAIIPFILGTFILVITRSFRSALSLPVGIVIDDKKANCCEAQTFWDLKPDDSTSRRFCDILMSLVLEVCVILHWHGIWTLLDLYSYYTDHSHSLTGFISLGVGCITFFMSFLLQFPFTIFCQKPEVSMAQKLAVNFLVTFVGVVATVNTFRGYWYLMDEYILPDQYEVSLLNSMIYGAILLYCLHCGSSMHAGIIRDIEQGTMVETCYISYFFIKAENVCVSKTYKDQSNENTEETTATDLLISKLDNGV